MSASTKAVERPPRPSLLLGAGHLAALWALAFLQPMLSLLGKNPEFFVARGNTAGQIIVYSLALAFVPPLIGLALEALAQLISKDLRWGLHLVLMTLVGACFLLQLSKDFSLPAGLLIALSILVAALGVYAYSRWRFPRAFMDVMIVAPVVILVVFFFISSTSRLILPREQPDPVDVTVGNPAPVVMVIFDEFPTAALMNDREQVDRTRFPAFAELASDSTWYKNASGSAAYSPLAVPSIMTGEEPVQDNLPIAADYPHSVFTLLGKSYRLRVMEAVTRVCPEDLCPESATGPDDAGLGDLFSDLETVSKYLLLPESLTRNLPDISNSFSGFSNESADPSDAGDNATGPTGATGPTAESELEPPERTGQGAARRLGRLFATRSSADEFERINEFIGEFDPGQNETLDLIHVEKPHYPWRHLPNGQRYSNLTGEWSGLLPNDGPWMAPPKVVDIALQRHLLEVGYTDTLLQRVIGRLKADGLWDDSLVVVTADHGAAFSSRIPRRAAVRENMGEVASVPLFIKAPGQRQSKVVTRHTCATDVVPEIASQLEIDYPWETVNCPADQVTMINSPAGEATVPLPTMLKQRRRLVDRIQRVYGTGEGWGPTYRFGPRNELIGRKVADLKVVPKKPRQLAEAFRPNAVKHYDPASPSLKGLLQRGYLERITENRVLAVAVGGKIVATGWTFKDGFGFGPGFSILLPPESLKRGFNQVDIYLLESGGRELALVRDGSKPFVPEQ